MNKFRIFLKTVLFHFLLQTSKKLKSKKKQSAKFKMVRLKGNPIMSPTQNREWESEGTFNPAVLSDHKDQVYMLYRALGKDGISRFGYAISDSGENFENKLSYPVFSVETKPVKINLKNYSKFEYPSGGGLGGAEDPRMVNIEGTIYVTFNTFDNWDNIRVTVVQIFEEDFYKQKFDWSKPEFISPANEIHKNWVLFPEKINGKFAILHSITPEIQIDYIQDFKDLASGKVKIKSEFSKVKNTNSWDTWIRGVGPSPIKTKKGWLVLYHAINESFPHQYRLGAMLLDLNNPTKIIAKSPSHLIMPEMWYENDWKLGVVYACGAIIRDQQLHIYYGGGDKHICLAKTPLDDLLCWMQNS